MKQCQPKLPDDPNQIAPHAGARIEAAAADAARPIGEDGKVKLDPKLNDAREDAIVKNVVGGGPVSVLILGGAHDLSDNVPKGCQYIRVGTKAHEAMAGK